MKAWNMSSRQIGEVSTLVRLQLAEEAFVWGDGQIRRFITEVGPDLLDDFLALAQAELLPGGCLYAGGTEKMDRFRACIKTQLGLISAFSVRELALGGEDVMKILGIRFRAGSGESATRAFRPGPAGPGPQYARKPHPGSRAKLREGR